MAALSCEICGGKLMAKAGGIFECDSCGMMYDKTRIQEMVQEIKGTVKVEGTVQVAGTVKVEGGVNIESLLKRGQLALEDQQWKKASQYFDDALNLDAECAKAYLGKFCARMNVHEASELLQRSLRLSQVKELQGDSDFQKALRFAGAHEAVKLNDKWNEMIRADQAYVEQAHTVLSAIRRKIEPAQGLICARVHIVGLRSNGTVVSTDSREQVSYWRDVVAICAGTYHTVGLRADGTVVAVGENEDGQCDVSDWRDVVAICAGDNHTLGLRSDGTVVTTIFETDWKLFNSLETIEQEREEAAARKAEEARQEAERKAAEARLEAERKAEEARLETERKAKRAAELNAEKSALCTELSNLKGLFTGRRRKEIESRLERIENELKTLD